VVGSLRQRRPGSWELRVHAGRDEATGKVRYVSQTVRGTRQDAERELELFATRVRDSPTSPTFGTVGELCDKWWRYTAGKLSPAVAAEYRRIIDKRIGPAFGSVKVDALRTSELDAWYAELLHPSDGSAGLADSSVRNTHSVLHRALQQGVAWGWIGRNPASWTSPPPRHRPRLQLPTVEDVNALIAAATTVNAALPVFLRLAAISGARRGELCALRWRHLDQHGAVLHISGAVGQTRAGLVERATKTHAERRLSLDAGTIEALERLRPAGDADVRNRYVFSHDADGGRPWRPNYVTLAFRRLVQQLGLQQLRLHDLRHFAATTMLVNGVDVRTAAGRLGHARASTTLDIYAHFTPVADQRAASTLAVVLDRGARGVSDDDGV
jgi:integrase